MVLSTSTSYCNSVECVVYNIPSQAVRSQQVVRAGPTSGATPLLRRLGTFDAYCGALDFAARASLAREWVVALRGLGVPYMYTTWSCWC